MHAQLYRTTFNDEKLLALSSARQKAQQLSDEDVASDRIDQIINDIIETRMGLCSFEKGGTARQTDWRRN